MLHDPISDLLTRIRNAQKQQHRYVDIPLSKQKMHIAKVLEKTRFIKEVIVNQKRKLLRVVLRYQTGLHPVINGLKRASKPGLRLYVGHKNIPKSLGGLGIVILSTNIGIIDGETAREKKVGGELLCYIW